MIFKIPYDKYCVNSEKNKIELFKNFLFISVVFLFVAMFYGSGIFTNISTPSGDAKRIKHYVHTFNSLEETLPLWVSHKNAGTPLLADPEQIFYFFLIPLLSIGGEKYYNLNLNIAIYIFLCIHAVTVYFLLGSFNISKFSSAMGALLVTCSGIIYINYLSGRLNTLAIFSAAVFIIPTYKWFIMKREVWIFAILSALVGFLVVFSGYYAFVYIMILTSYALGLHIENNLGFRSAFICTARDIGIASICGLCLFSFLFIPLCIYQLDFLAKEGYGQLLKLPEKGSIINFFMPLVTFGEKAHKQIVFPHVSILLCPGILLLFAQKNWKSKASILLPVFLSFLLLLITVAFLLPVDLFVEAYASVPFLGDVRHSLVYTYVAGLLLLAGSIYAVDKSIIEYNYFKLLILVVCFFVILFAIDWLGMLYEEQKSSYLDSYGHKIFIYALILTLVIFLYARVGYLKWSVWFLLISVVVFQMAIPKWQGLGYKRTDNNLFVCNESLIKGVKHTNTDRLLLAPNHWPPLVFEDQHEIFGFSMYFSPYYRNALSYLLNKPILEQRPSWINTGFSLVTNEGIEMFNVKHALYKKIEKPPDLKWEKIAANEGYVLWKYSSHNNNSRGIKIFDNWQVTGNKDKIKNVRQAWHNDIILLDSDPDIEKHDNIKLEYGLEVINYTPSKIKLHITTSKPVVVFLSEIYAESWKAQVNGNDVPVLKAYQAFRAIPVPKGESELTLSYCLWEFYIGIFISVLTIFFLLITIMIRNR